MLSVVRYLCNQFKCEVSDLSQNISLHHPKVSAALEKHPLYISCCDIGEEKDSNSLTEVPFCGLTVFSAKDLYSCGGQFDIKVVQNCYIKRNRYLQHPELPCVIERQGYFGGELYIPLEFLKIDIKKAP